MIKQQWCSYSTKRSWLTRIRAYGIHFSRSLQITVILIHRTILSMSQGSPTRINAPATAMFIKQRQMVTLVPIDHRDGLEAAGLFLTRPEFDDLRKYSFDPTCVDFIFRISSGQAGAMDDVINLILYFDLLRHLCRHAANPVINTVSTPHCPLLLGTSHPWWLVKDSSA